jgi:hypothetical protein
VRRITVTEGVVNHLSRSFTALQRDQNALTDKRINLSGGIADGEQSVSRALSTEIEWADADELALWFGPPKFFLRQPVLHDRRFDETVGIMADVSGNVLGRDQTQVEQAILDLDHATIARGIKVQLNFICDPVNIGKMRFESEQRRLKMIGRSPFPSARIHNDLSRKRFFLFGRRKNAGHTDDPVTACEQRLDAKSLDDVNAARSRLIEKNPVERGSADTEAVAAPARELIQRHAQLLAGRRCERRMVDSIRVRSFDSLTNAEPLKDRHALRRDELAAKFIARELLTLKQQHAIAARGQTDPSRRASRTAANDDDIVLHFFPTMTTR